MNPHRTPTNVVHFAIHADDVERARRFYEAVFGWRFEPWGPPDFYLIHTGPDDASGVHGALQLRTTPLEGRGIRAYECTISVRDLDETTAAIEAHGGTIREPKSVIPTVGALVQFQDTEGNIACAMHYDGEAAPSL